MKQLFWKKAVVCLAAGAAALSAAAAASAAPCSALPSATYITGSSAVKPFIAGLGQALAGTTTLVYKGQGSCLGVDAVFNGTKITGTASYWDSAGMEQSCDLDAAGTAADVGVSDVFSSTCSGFGPPPAGIGDFFGPNQVMTFVVPKGSSQTLLSADAAYFVYGFGMQGMVSPWNNDTFIFQRSATSGTQSMIAAAINVPPSKWKGVPQSSSGNMLTAVANATQVDAAIGILAATDADGARDKVKILAYQHTLQDCAWLPDSTSTSFDKINVRDGHYPIWGPVHFFAKIDGTNTPMNPEANKLVGYFTGKVQTPAGVNLLDLEIAAHTVPACAMKVQRSAEMGAVSAFSPMKACGCYFESKANGAASASCTTCAMDADCTGTNKHCNYGYCEAN